MTLNTVKGFVDFAYIKKYNIALDATLFSVRIGFFPTLQNVQQAFEKLQKKTGYALEQCTPIEIFNPSELQPNQFLVRR